MQNAVFVQATGLFTLPDGRTFKGYAGRWNGRNNPDMEHVKDVGPLPAGTYAIRPPISHPRLGPLAFRLVADGNAPTYGRGGFFIHGDNAANDASSGCIILSRTARETLLATDCRTLVVRHFPPRVVHQCAA